MGFVLPGKTGTFMIILCTRGSLQLTCVARFLGFIVKKCQWKSLGKLFYVGSGNDAHAVISIICLL